MTETQHDDTERPEPERLTMTAFVDRYHVTMTAERISDRPDRGRQTAKEAEWDRTAFHWRCIFRIGRRSLRVYFSQGSAITSEPTTVDVLDCLAQDAASYENAPSYEEWARDLGYDEDSRSGERAYTAIGKQVAGLHRLFDDAAYDQLLWHTERE